MTAKLKPSEIISDYMAAFESANGHRNVRLSYEGGWFCFRYSERGKPVRYRRKDIFQMIRRLVELKAA